MRARLAALSCHAKLTVCRDAVPGRQVATAIREGAEGFLSTQYSTIARYVVVVAVMLFCLYLTRPPPHPTISTFAMACLMRCVAART